MRTTVQLFVIILLVSIVSGCALGQKEWPSAVRSEDTFAIRVTTADRQAQCLSLTIAISGAVSRLYRASIQYEPVGDEGGDGCVGCPFVPREAEHYLKEDGVLAINNNQFTLSFCGFEPDKEYRFRVAAESELPSAPLVYTDIFATQP